MLEKTLSHIPPDFIKFILVIVFSLLIGLEQRRRYIEEKFESLFGTDRTFTLIGIFGYILYVIEPQSLAPFLGGGIVIAFFLGLYYWQKIKLLKKFGITSMVTALITYCLAPLIYKQPEWLVLMIVVSVLIITEIKETLFEFSKKFDKNEFITLAKFLVFAGIILPLLPDTSISADIPISPYKFWIAIVGVSGLSYLSYILKKFVFPKSGIILTGILGGLYSSTATTIILARKSKKLNKDNKIVSAIIFATSMMYLRIFLLALLFNAQIAIKLIPSFSILIVASVIIGLVFLRSKKIANTSAEAEQVVETHDNPLEFKTAMIFGVLFVFFALVTGYVIKHYGAGGVNILSFVVGVTDIDPFILNLVQSKMECTNAMIVVAILNAVSSNNLLKMIYGAGLADKSIRRQLIIGFGILILLGLLLSFVFHF